jgi:hypothetical protein
MNNKLADLIKAQIQGFSWSNYGLDLVENVLEEDWVDDLAVEIAVSITDRVEVEL